MAQTASNPTDQTIKNTNRWQTKELVTMALMCAIAALLSFIEFPIMPDAGFLKLDLSLTPVAITGLAYGSGAGIVVGIVCALVHAAISGNWVGAIMNIIVAIAFVLPSAAIYNHNRTFKNGVIGLVVSSIVMIVAAIVGNLIIDPAFYGIPFETVVMLTPIAILPFNIIKAIVNSLLTGVIYKRISNLITPAKDQVRGR